MEVSVITPKTTMMMLGGMRTSSPPAEATTPRASLLW